MKTMKRDGVALAYEEVGTGTPPILFVHGWGCDHTVFAPQASFFSRAHRVVSVDLRGHGASDAPHQDYTMAGFVADIAWQCAQLGLERPIVVGHSMGGTVALELASRHPDLPAAIVLIDSVILPPASFIDAFRSFGIALRGQDYLEALQEGASSLFIATDDPARKARLLASMANISQHVLASAFSNHVTEYDATAAALACRVPTAYIGAAVSMVDLVRFRAASPQLMTGQTLGSGHFSPLEVPDQINSMLLRFFSISIGADREQR
jgi:pimeloyl-ACP methyl ester carboxylesterase